MKFDLEYAQSQEPQYDFCLWEYPPPAPPAGKLRSINLLANSFHAEGFGSRAFEVTDAIRQGLGDGRSVWGIKQENGVLSWEYYFYDYARLERERSIPRVLSLIRPWIACDIQTSERQPYFMFSLDFGREHLLEGRPIEEIQMYIGNIGSLVSSGICYAVTQKQMRLKNLYYFFNTRREWQEIVGKLTSSVHLDIPDLDLDAILWPEMRDCQTTVVSNKQQRDGVYFSRISVDQLLLFLKRMRYPESHVSFVEENRGKLDHMLYDVGVDFCVKDGSLAIVKSAYYGVF